MLHQIQPLGRKICLFSTLSLFFINCKNDSASENQTALETPQKPNNVVIMADDLGFSLGKLNYVIKALKKKGHIKVKNFKNNKNKINYLYILTPQGISAKTKLTLNFMRLKMREYDELRQELRKK